jgi:REP element-mobilizing transposase RayT
MGNVFGQRIKGRRTLRLSGYDYSIYGPYYVTICTHKKRCLFGKVINGEMVLNQVGRIVNDEWIKAGESRGDLELDEWVLMPNHLHGIVSIIEDSPVAIRELPLHGTVETEDSLPEPDIFTRAAYEFPVRTDIRKRRNMILPKFIGRFKMLSSKRVNSLRGTPGKPLWQKSYWDRIIRDEKDLNRIRSYIRNNPSQWEKDYLYGE